MVRQPQDVRHACSTGVDHIRHTHDPARNAFSVGQPEHGRTSPTTSENLVALHDASTIAAVIVEPVAGSTGVLVPPKGYLQRLRGSATSTASCRSSTRSSPVWAAPAALRRDTFGVTPDMITCAKGMTNGCVPMGAVMAQGAIHDTFERPRAPDRVLPRLHLFGAPLACAAGLATLETYADEGLLTRAADPAGLFRPRRCTALKGQAQRDRHPQHRPVGGIELGAMAGRADAARLRRLPADCYGRAC